jgi:tetratricopeptide (TPR) repeat protein
MFSDPEDKPMKRWWPLTLCLLHTGFTASVSAQDNVCDSAVDYTAIGQAAFAQGNYVQAVADYTCAVEVDPLNYQAYFGRGQASLFLGQVTEDFYRVRLNAPNATRLFRAAVEEYTAQIESNPADMIAYQLRAFTYWFTSQDEMALADYEQLLSLDPQNALFYALRGSSNLHIGNAENAAEDFDRALALDSDNAHIHRIIGASYAQTGETELALGYLNQAVELAPDDAFTYMFRAFVHEIHEDFDVSARDYARFIDLRARERTVEKTLQPDSEIVLPMTSGRVYEMPIEAKAGEVLTIWATSPRFDVDTLILLLGPDGEPLIGSGDILLFESTNSLIEGFAVPANGTYTLLVTHSGGGSEGEVEISLTIDAPMSEVVAEEPGMSFEACVRW